MKPDANPDWGIEPEKPADAPSDRVDDDIWWRRKGCPFRLCEGGSGWHYRRTPRGEEPEPCLCDAGKKNASSLGKTK